MTTKKTSRQAGDGQLLSAADILSGAQDLTVLELPELPKNGKPGVVHLRKLSAGDVLEFTEYAENHSEGDAMLMLMARSVVNPDGSPLFTEEQAKHLRDISVDAFKRISEAVALMMGVTPAGGEEGNARGEA